MKGILYTLLLITFILTACHNHHYDLISTTTRKIAYMDDAYLKVKVFNNADCDLSCKHKLTFVAINDNNFPFEVSFEKNFRFASHDSVVDQKIILKAGDSVVIACGCAEKVEPPSRDWLMDLTVVSAQK